MPAKPGNQNARKHGAYSKKAQTKTTTPKPRPAHRAAPPRAAPTIDDQIQKLADIQNGLSDFIDELQTTKGDTAAPGDADTVLKAFALVAQNASRMVRMLQAKQLLERPNNLEWLDKALDLVKGEVHNAIIDRRIERTLSEAESGRVHA
jgi:hypothetical protein